jgi:hypothetical protein
VNIVFLILFTVHNLFPDRCQSGSKRDEVRLKNTTHRVYVFRVEHINPIVERIQDGIAAFPQLLELFEVSPIVTVGGGVGVVCLPLLSPVTFKT